ncbi:hypothetical protein J3459_006480 [Metarhizium acridum]|nr:hypothetical protein J3459_006480 [Metarhizium acridum]
MRTVLVLSAAFAALSLSAAVPFEGKTGLLLVGGEVSARGEKGLLERLGSSS